ncbi:Crp/Fnr family transcriptional regulator [Chitinophaga niabensis]|uniref:cAMP-binding domain of CRP or a regulatory subunit of cAMP-dependent protein kinases n=1 Tax=Chitinophaga niabensis TaxID=536979 RepID=A0A1N6F1I4_9BACT|nr:Crp/Fnr family transcriptional regulator [Chitinophaga niabensis]SIN89124.1 cAMP-binding domain of CRP or a regulatory subunit of cAMP-dependent protein kinases [Chitinophaga niabensis]
MKTDLLLENIKMHISLDKEEAGYFLGLIRSNTIKRKGFLLKQGEICRYESFITKGCLRVYTLDNNGVEHVVMFGIENWWVSDLRSFLMQTPAQYMIDALEDTEVLQISKPDIDQLYEKVPKFERFFRIILQNAFVAHQQRIEQNLSFSAEERYHFFTDKYPHMDQRIPQKQIASYLGITPVFLSMLRRKQLKK